MRIQRTNHQILSETYIKAYIWYVPIDRDLEL